jgi:hypothetical protein
MISAPAFPPPDPSDPDEVGWPMCTAAAYWRQGRYEESIEEVERAAVAARELKLGERADALTGASATLRAYVKRWEEGHADADPKSVPISEEYPSIEVLEAFVAMEELRSNQAHTDETAGPPLAATLPSGIFGSGARALPKLRRIFPRPEVKSPLVLDFDGSILAGKPVSDDDEPPLTRRSDRPKKG